MTTTPPSWWRRFLAALTHSGPSYNICPGEGSGCCCPCEGCRHHCTAHQEKKR
ncbi:hypothetical protein FB465_2067 [Kitasatospora atroaurantiaca]|uniref:Uncharacterized protein n=1 Tax=Kitasatospora atroaurantiaca TaxID=285545 RepID=A0A561EN68_9ACTN|nr:hypothetical protein FB465_2067 [Kitasatospora atroaurantiaca]